MAGIKLIPYTVEIHPNREASKNDLWDLSDLQQYNPTLQTQLGQSSDKPKLSNINTFTDLFHAFCQDYEENLTDLGEESEQLSNVTFALSTDWKSSEKVVEGNLYLGNYGVVRNLVNRESGKRRERGRDIDDAEEKPLYFMMYTPSENATEAYLLLERSRRYGAKDPFHFAVRQWIRKHYSGELNMKIDPIKTDEIFPKMREADRTVRLRLEKDGSPGQLHSNFNSVFNQDEMKQAIEFRPQSGDDMNLIVDELESWYNEPGTSFERIDGIPYNNIKITIEKNDSDETISLTKGEAGLRKNIDLRDISDEGDIPVLTEISERAHSFLRTVTGYDTGTSSLFK